MSEEIGVTKSYIMSQEELKANSDDFINLIILASEASFARVRAARWWIAQYQSLIGYRG